MQQRQYVASSREFLIAWAAGAALVCASFANFMTHNEYPLLRPEVCLVLLLLVTICAVLTPLYLGQRQWGRSFLEGLLAALFVDLNSSSTVLVIAAGIAVAAFTLWRRTSILAPMALFGTVVLVTTLVGGTRSEWLQSVQKQGGSRPDATAERPAILHLILDEHIGIEGLPADAESQRIKEELKAFYLNRGFALYGRAYSQHMHTVNAIPAVLNYGEQLAENASTTGVVVGQNRHLQKLTDDGYRLTIFQSDFADFCTGSAFFECVTYDSSSLHPTQDFNLSTMERAKLIALKFSSLSEIFNLIIGPWDLASLRLRRAGFETPLIIPSEDSRSSSVGTLRALGDLKARLEKAKPGDAFFAHLLLPHYPYVVAGDCSALRFKEWKRRFGYWPPEALRHAYAGQLQCATSQVDELLQAFDRSPAGSNSLVFVHGDHGSRLTSVDPSEEYRGQFGREDVIAAYSTLFAVRAPAVRAGYYTEPYPIHTLLRDFSSSTPARAPSLTPPKVHEVWLDDEDWKPSSKIRLPASWLN